MQTASPASVRRLRLSRRAAMTRLSSSPACNSGPLLRSAIPSPLPARTLRPSFEIVDVVTHVAAVAAEEWPCLCRSHLLELAGAQTQIEGRLLGRQEWTSLLRPSRAGDVVIHEKLASSKRAGLPAASLASAPARRPCRGSNLGGYKIEPPARRVVRPRGLAAGSSSATDPRAVAMHEHCRECASWRKRLRVG